MLCHERPDFRFFFIEYLRLSQGKIQSFTIERPYFQLDLFALKNTLGAAETGH
jgi:hypothetical protein